MSKRIELKPHLSTDELYARYRETSDLIERARWQALWRLSQGLPREEVARSMGYSAEWVRQVAARYNQGLAEIADGRHRNRGHVPLLDEQQFKELECALESPLPDGTPWSGPKVAHWIGEKLGRPVAPQRGWDYLRRAGQTPQRPRPQHQGADVAAQSCFQESLAAHV